MRRSIRLFIIGCAALGWSAAATAQVTPAAGYTPPDDTQAIRIGTTIYADYTYQTSPDGTNADGSTFNFNAFDLKRTYLNVTGNISHVVAFRLTPDIFRETTCPASGCTGNGSITFRIKYGYLQTNFDDWMSRGSWARFGVHQTPYLDYTEGIYRYRFQGTMFIERVGKQSSADAGASFHYNFAKNYGDVHVGVYNGENYNKAEVNNQKAVKLRATIRPFATNNINLRGLRASFYLDSDNVVADAERRRIMGHITYEHPHFVAAYEYLSAHDQTAATAAKVDSGGYSIWVTPRVAATSTGWEGLLRYDHFTPNKSTDATGSTTFDQQKQNRVIAGVAYWFPHPGGGATTALMFDYDGQMFDNIATSVPSTIVSGIPPVGSPAKAVAVHLLINY